MRNNNLPLIVSCSGCCQGGELAEDIATLYRQQGKAERIAIAAIAARSPLHLQRIALSKQLIVFDGCSLCCIKHCLTRSGINKFIHFDITKLLNELPKQSKQSVLQAGLQVTTRISKTLATSLSSNHEVDESDRDANIIALFPCADG
ncbi:putative zinc-binding protein [Pseudoalteromonas sp. T1lg23B]|uniref:putative zinc-binding protein n=1 Tax=Pseudoalteromonas sp. T1lg23B TaxID=2077097 RepID=UPI000CF6CA91|nr:putative zinc-binding protein [Pseudoalteromonas sp. T1lg23B]